MNLKKQTKALVMLSGGLDSMLAAKILMEQGIECTGICFKSNFFNCNKARITAEKLSIGLKEIDISKEILELVKKPPSGYGKNLNPCIDCHSLMARKARRIIKKEGFDFLATGEVLGQRPFSQNKNALNKIINLSGVSILRPLCAKLLLETDIEKKGLVDRSKLLDISGRNRERQFILANKYNIKDYPSPSGGCLLTDPEFSKRLKIMIEKWPGCSINDIEILKYGRIFWMNKVLVIIGRHKEDNEMLEELFREEDIKAELKDINGPTALIRGHKMKEGDKELELLIPESLDLSQISSNHILLNTALLIGYYSTKARGRREKVIFKKI